MPGQDDKTLRAWLQPHRGKPLDAIIEQIRDAANMRVYLPTLQQYLWVALTGLRAPAFGRSAAQPAHPLAAPAKHFCDVRLLQRHVSLRLDGTPRVLV